MDVSVFAIIGAGLLFGISVGVGVAIGLEVVMRLTGDGRTVLLTWARTKTSET